MSASRPLGTFNFLLAQLTPWRPAYRVRAAQSGLAFFAHRRDVIGRHVAKYGTHEPLLTQWIADYLGAAAPGIMIDVGANLGWHAVHAAIHPNVETVVAFEPEPFNAWLLEQSLTENAIENVIVDARAVGAAPGVARLFRYKSSNYGRHTLVRDHGYGYRRVPVIDLDSALTELGLAQRPISLIKIDVEGYEPAVIAGAARTLTRTGAVVLEYSPEISRTGGLSDGDMLRQLDDLGFAPFVLRHHGGTSDVEIGDLRAFGGAIDVIWLRTASATAAVMRAMNERPRGSLTVFDIAEQNKQVKTPIPTRR